MRGLLVCQQPYLKKKTRPMNGVFVDILPYNISRRTAWGSIFWAFLLEKLLLRLLRYANFKDGDEYPRHGCKASIAPLTHWLEGQVYRLPTFRFAGEIFVSHNLRRILITTDRVRLKAQLSAHNLSRRWSTAKGSIEMCTGFFLHLLPLPLEPCLPNRRSRLRQGALVRLWPENNDLPHL